MVNFCRPGHILIVKWCLHFAARECAVVLRQFQRDDNKSYRFWFIPSGRGTLFNEDPLRHTVLSCPGSSNLSQQGRLQQVSGLLEPWSDSIYLVHILFIWCTYNLKTTSHVFI